MTWRLHSVFLSRMSSDLFYSTNLLMLFFTRLSKVTEEVALIGCTCKKALIEGCSGESPLMLKSGSRQQKEESGVERRKSMCCVTYLRGFQRAPLYKQEVGIFLGYRNPQQVW